MPDDTQDDGFGKELETAFNGGEEVVENPATPAVEEAKTPEPAAPATPPAPAKVEEPKEDEPKNPTDPNKKDEEPVTPPADPAKPAEEDLKTPETPEAPQAPAADEPKPLTEEGVRRLLQEARAEERDSGVALQNATKDVMDAYYPDGLSNVLVDQTTGKELRTPQDVIDASNGELTAEQAAQWLMNEQYKLDQNIAGIQKQAETIAETNITFRRDAMLALQKYEPLFKQYPQLQTKAYDLMMKQVTYDEKRDLITKAPDVLDLYDTYLEPYQRAYEFSTNQPATNPVTPPAPAPATPGINDRLDEGGDGGANTEVNDPNDFAQQVTKALENPF